MSACYILCVPFFLVSIGVEYTLSMEGVSMAYDRHGVVPEVMSECPGQLVQIHYRNSNAAPNYGNYLAPEDTAEAPLLAYDHAEDTYYTLVMFDPDVPTRKNPIQRSWLHWLVCNIPGDDVDKGIVLADYTGPAPTKGSGPHRYIFLVYEQRSGEIIFGASPDTEISKRGFFDLDRFASIYKLLNPVAGNFFLAVNH